jgi:hemerythrin-like domain-containing protein
LICIGVSRAELTNNDSKNTCIATSDNPIGPTYVGNHIYKHSNVICDVDINTLSHNNNNVEPEVKKKISQALKDGQKRYYNKIKSAPEFQELRRAYSKKHY